MSAPEFAPASGPAIAAGLRPRSRLATASASISADAGTASDLADPAPSRGPAPEARLDAISVDGRDAEVPSDIVGGAVRANRSRLKRLLDIFGAAAGLVILGPFLTLIAMLIRLESPGPALFRQRRAGLHGVAFEIYKFRSMVAIEDGPNVRQAARSDERLTRLGLFLRRSCIDELPQLLNVLKGEMSLVGPRPHALAHDRYYRSVIPGYERRLLVRPGIAGLAQVSGYRGATPTIESMAGRVALDQEYIANWSLGADVRILLQAVSQGPFHPAAF